MIKCFIACALAFLAFAQPAFSQDSKDPPAETSGNPGGFSPATPGADRGKPAPNTANTADQVFTRQAALGGRAEVDLGKLAGSRAQNAAVKAFARQMVDDHTKANDRVMRLAKSHDVAIPKDLDPDQKAVRAQLDPLRGGAFDTAYINAQVGDHQATAHLLEYEIGSGQDEQVKALAMETLPTVLRHLEMARGIQQELTGK